MVVILNILWGVMVIFTSRVSHVMRLPFDLIKIAIGWRHCNPDDRSIRCIKQIERLEMHCNKGER
jgi:hypothetical protein